MRQYFQQILPILSCERPFKFPRHLVGTLGIIKIIAMLDITIHRAVFKLARTRKQIRKRTREQTWKQRQTWKRKLTNTDLDMYPDMDMEFGNFSILFNTAQVPMAPYGLPLTDYGAIANGAIYLLHLFMMPRMKWEFSKIHSDIENALPTMC
jgi:hypothetical protein